MLGRKAGARLNKDMFRPYTENTFLYFHRETQMYIILRLWFLEERFVLDLKGWLGCGENREGYIPSSQQGFMGPLSIRVLRCKQQKLTLDDFLKKEL